MNAAEHVVKLWLESKGFFVMGPICARHHCEVDLLAISLNPCKNSVAEKLHVEVTVSGRPAGRKDTATDVATYAAKFSGYAGDRAKDVLGENYSRWLVIAKKVGGESLWYLECSHLNPPVTVIFFADVVKEYVDYASQNAAPADQIGKLLDTLKKLDLLRWDSA